VEIAEAITPLLFWKKQLRSGSGGRGRTRGGLGQEIEIESGIAEPFELLAAFDRIEHPPRGRHGGEAGAAGAVAIKDGRKLAGKGTQWVQPGERLVVMTPGGGGLGPAAERDADRLAIDLREERTSG
jgi:N-methylhydantoinase B